LVQSTAFLKTYCFASKRNGNQSRSLSLGEAESVQSNGNLSSNSAKTFAYSYTDPLLESPPEASIWGQGVDRIYQDVGDRQQWQQLLQDCRMEPPSCLRLRRLEDLGDSLHTVSDCLSELARLGVAIEVQDGAETVPLSWQHGDLIQVLQSVQDAQRRRSLQRGHAQNRLKGVPPPGKAPYGYRRGKDRYILDRSTAPVVKDFFEHFLLYGSLRGSVRYLQKKYGKKISVSTGKRWLTSPVYRGDLLYQNGQVIPDTHVPIMSRDEAAQVDRLLRRNQRLPPRTASAPRSLSGLVICSKCQSPWAINRTTTRRGQEYLYLRPTRCSERPACQSLAYQAVLEQTIQQICQELPRAVAAAQVPNVDAIKQNLTAEITARQDILQQLPALVESGVLDRETAELRAYKVRTEIASLRNQTAQLPPVNLSAIAQVVSLPQFWLDLSEAERRFYFREFIRHIQITQQPSTWTLQLVFIF
jgi:DNA invertase Pin-like site-specific DNA recombinase